VKDISTHKSVLRHVPYTVKPVLRGHLRYKDKVTL